MNNSISTDTRAEPDSTKRERTKLKLSKEEKQDLWSVLLDKATQGKRLPEKSLIVLGMELRTSLNEVEANDIS